jgi:predicted TIM-barrel fold metal-dependent hydrolase
VCFTDYKQLLNRVEVEEGLHNQESIDGQSYELSLHSISHTQVCCAKAQTYTENVYYLSIQKAMTAAEDRAIVTK